MKLPVYKGYTVDFRLKEFRKFREGYLPEFIDFNSYEGDNLLAEMIKKGLVPHETLVNLF